VIERKIKELSIALEALSRINQNFQSKDWFGQVESLLGEALQKAKEENNPLYTHTPPPPSPRNDDDIPF
jgi:hypothetical protein